MSFNEWVTALVGLRKAMLASEKQEAAAAAEAEAIETAIVEEEAAYLPAAASIPEGDRATFCRAALQCPEET